MSSTIKTPRYIMNLDKTAYIPAPLRKLLNPKNNALPDTHELCLVGQEETMNNDLDDKNYTGLRFIHIEKNKKAYNLLSTKLQKAVDVINDMIKRENSSFNKNDCCGIHTLGMVPKSEITALNELGYGLLSWHGLFVYEQTSTTTTSTTTYNTPYNFNTIKGQSFTTTLTTLTSFENLGRVLISIDSGATYLSINDSYTLEFVDSSDLITTEGKTTYGALLKATFQLVTETNSSGSYYRLDSEMHPMYSLDIIKDSDTGEDTLVFNNAWDYNRSVSTVNSDYTGGYVLFEITSTSLTPYKRYKYNVDLDTTTDDTAFSEDTTTTFSSELYYDGSNLTLSSSSYSSFTFYESDLDLDIPSDFNPLSESRVSNYSVLWESIDNLTDVSENALYGGTSSTIYKDIQSTYQPQITTMGYDTGTNSTRYYAEEMLAEIFTTASTNSFNIRYEKSLYTSFRDAMLQTTLQSYGIVNGELGLNTVPYVFFTNEQDDDDEYHPFMVIGSWSISDKPNRLIDVTTPPGEGGGVDYAKGNVTRSTTLGTYLMKIPMRDYGEITNVTDNDLTTVGTNLRDDGGYNVTYNNYNYASISAVGVAIDGVPIYPLLNNTLTVAQEKAEITNTGIHVGQGLQLHWHADGHSATGNGLNLYNLPDYVDNDHPPLIGFGLDGIALYGKYEASYSSMDGYSNELDDYGGHTHDDYGYHYHAHTVKSVEEGLSDTSYTCHILMKGAWIGAIDDIPDFWDSDTKAPRLSGSSSDSIYAGGSSTT